MSLQSLNRLNGPMGHSACQAELKQIGFGEHYVPQRPVLINRTKGNTTYTLAITAAGNLYTRTDDRYLRDNTHNAMNGFCQQGGPISV